MRLLEIIKQIIPSIKNEPIEFFKFLFSILILISFPAYILIHLFSNMTFLGFFRSPLGMFIISIAVFMFVMAIFGNEELDSGPVGCMALLIFFIIFLLLRSCS